MISVSSRGKSGKVKSEIIKQKNLTIYMLEARIAGFKRTIENLREEKNSRLTPKQVAVKKSEIREQKNRKLTNLKQKVARRDSIVEIREKTVEELSLIVKQNEKEILRLVKLIETKSAKIQEISQRKRKKIYKYRDKPLSAEAKRLNKILDGGITDAKYNFFVNTIKIVKFAKDKRITPDLLSVILQVEMESSLMVKDMKVGTRSILNTGVRLEYINYQLANGIKHYYLTNKGTEIVKEFRNFVSYSKL